MSAYDIPALIAEWIASELDDLTTIGGEEFGHAVTMLPVPQASGASAIAWMLLITLRHPLLGHDHLGATNKVMANVPAESAVRQITRTAAELLRQSFEQAKTDILSKGNGHATLPAGLKGKSL